MSGISVSLASDLVGLLQTLDRPLEESVRELLVLELYRQARISSGKAAELLGMERVAFIQHSSALGIPFFDMSEEEWQAEIELIRKL